MKQQVFNPYLPSWEYIPDGKLLNHIHVMDLCTIMGNALDNAIEYELQVENPDERLIHTKSGLGVSPIISVAYSISTIGNLNFGDTTFALYAIFVMIEMLLHTLTGRIPQTKGKNSLVLTLGKDLLQLPLSLVFTRFMNLFSGWIPAPSHGFISQLIVLILGIVCTGIGAAMSLNMRLIPNPGDGIVQTIADCIHKPVGFTKNCFDMVNICITISVGMLFAHKLIGVGIGTVIAVLGVGRVIALFNWLCMKKRGIRGRCL